MLRPKGYSLLDILVLAALVALILVLVLPALSHIRAADRRAQCASNLNQLAKAMFMYADVPSNGLFPTRAAAGDPYADDKPLLALNLLYNKYVADPRVFACPESPPGVPVKIPELTAEQAEALKTALKDLAAEDFDAREKAFKKIQDIGFGAHAALRETLKTSSDAEVKARAGKLLVDFADGMLANRLKELTPTELSVLPAKGTFLSPDTCSYGYDPGHSPNDALAALMADRKGAGKNSDNHGASAGQNVLIGAGIIEWRDTPVHKVENKEDPDIFAQNPAAQLAREFDAFIRQ